MVHVKVSGMHLADAVSFFLLELFTKMSAFPADRAHQDPTAHLLLEAIAAHSNSLRMLAAF